MRHCLNEFLVALKTLHQRGNIAHLKASAGAQRAIYAQERFFLFPGQRVAADDLFPQSGSCIVKKEDILQIFQICQSAEGGIEDERIADPH